MKIDETNRQARTKSTGRITGRSAKGSSLVEVAAISFVLPIVILISVNVGVLVFAAWINDAACKDAARAAAQQSNSQDAFNAADLSLQRYSNTGGGIVGAPKILGVRPSTPSAQTPAGYFEFNTFPDPVTNQPQTALAPYVKVSTHLQAELPVPIVFNGVGFSNKIVFSQSYSYPVLAPNSPDDNSPEITADDVDDENALALADAEDAFASSQDI